MFVEIDNCQYNTDQIIKITGPLTYGGAEGDNWSVIFCTADDAVTKKFDTEAEAQEFIDTLTGG